MLTRCSTCTPPSRPPPSPPVPRAREYIISDTFTSPRIIYNNIIHITCKQRSLEPLPNNNPGLQHSPRITYYHIIHTTCKQRSLEPLPNNSPGLQYSLADQKCIYYYDYYYYPHHQRQRQRHREQRRVGEPITTAATIGPNGK